MTTTSQQAASTNDNKQNCFLFIFIAYFSPSIHPLRITILPPTLLHTFTNKRGNSDGTKEEKSSAKTHRKMRRKVENSHGTFCFSVSVSLQKVSSFLACPLFTLAASSHIHIHSPNDKSEEKVSRLHTKCYKGTKSPHNIVSVWEGSLGSSLYCSELLKSN